MPWRFRSIPLRPVGVADLCMGRATHVLQFFMLRRLFQRSSVPAPPTGTLIRAEQSLMAETLLLASSHLLGNPEPAAAIEHMCERMIAATPHIALAWAWFGHASAETMQPQVVVGMPSDIAGSITFERSDLTHKSLAHLASHTLPTRAIDVSNGSAIGQHRDLAQRLGLRSALMVPISNGDDVRGLLGFYSTRPKYFESAGVGLFEALGRWSHSVLAQSRQRPALDVDARRDSVTGLHSRRHAQHLMDDAWATPAELDNRGVLMLINIDGFSKINAARGTRVGDMTLRHVARVLEQNLRRSDVIARWGGGEFLAWLPSVSGSTALATAELLRASVADRPLDALDGWSAGLRVSIGATPVPCTDTFASALDRAGRALGAAKKNGRDCVVVARPGA